MTNALRTIWLVAFSILLQGAILMTAHAEYAEHARDPRLPLGRNPRERIAAWDKTITATDETVPNSAVLTYRTDADDAVYFNYLAKLMPVLQIDGAPALPSAATELQVEDFYGGVEATCRYGEVTLRTELIPLMVGRGVAETEGLVLYRVETTPPTPLDVQIGGGDKIGFVWGSSPLLRNNEVAPFGSPLVLEAGAASAQSGLEADQVAVSASGELSVIGQTDEQNGTLLAHFEGGSGYVLVGHAAGSERARELLATNVEKAEAALESYYAQLMKSHIKTPEPALDQAFSDVFYNLEYNWIEPYGWMECAHHWLVMWHMQATSGAEWMGQVDRSRMSNLVHIDKLLPNGAIPQLSAGGQARRTFGGSNQFWAWQVRHFWNFTGEKDFAERAAETLETVIDQTYEEHDEDNDLLIAWGKQIGNQEDFIFTPHNGSTSSMEAVNMLRTRAELALGAGDEVTAGRWMAKANAVRDELIRQLWLPDLGRFAFHTDSHGNLRLEGQYHTFIYPLLFNIVDAFDGYTSLRHMRDRLTDPNGEIYLSNNFPTHIVGTWGMQAGAAQQPWAAWGLSAAGLRNETYRPLKALAEWVGDLNHRGGWPEISKETAPGYFTPPAGLFVASVCEALYGLKMHAPQGAIEISPSFPDAWPEASLDLPEFKVQYTRSETRLSYALTTTRELARQLRWKLPPAEVETVRLNGKKIDFHLEPGVGYVTLVADTPATLDSTFEIELEPIDFTLTYPQSIAEGETLEIAAEGVEIVGIDDRHGVLGEMQLSDEKLLSAKIRTGLLDPYQDYGRLGQLNFSRRTFFIECLADDDVRFWQPIDLAILPPSEAAPAGEFTVTADGLNVTLKVRNNTDHTLEGEALLLTARQEIPFTVAVAARGEEQCTITVPAELATLLSLGDNEAKLMLPDDTRHDLTLTLSGESLKAAPALEAYFRSRVTEVSLEGKPQLPDTAWANLRNHPERHASVSWPGGTPPMDDMKEQTEVVVPGLEGLTFRFQERKFVPIGHWVDEPELSLQLGGKSYKKFYILMFTFIDNHEVFSPVATIDLQSRQETIKSRTLYFPGDVDWADASPVFQHHVMSTAHQERPNRFDLLTQLQPGDADWAEGLPAAFPQSEYWASSRVYKTNVSNLNVIEIDLKEPMPIFKLVIAPIGPTPAFGVLSVLGEAQGDLNLLSGEVWMPPAQYRPARTIFTLDSNEALEGWELEGDAFQIAGAIGQPASLNSLAQGEPGTGHALSPPFTLLDGENQIDVMLQGGRSLVVEGKENLCLQVIGAESGEVLREVKPSGSHILTSHAIKAEGLAGRPLRLKLLDRNSEPSFAWIGIREVSVRAVED